MKDGVLLKQYELGRLLGQGTFAKVYYARNLKTNTTVAVKVIPKHKISKSGLIDRMKQEISIMKLVKHHPNIIKLYEVLANKSKIYLVMEYAKGGELFDLVSKGKLSENAARQHFRQLINAVAHCHRHGVFHRDLKLENLMIDEIGNLKVADFGLSCVVDGTLNGRDGVVLRTCCGTPAYVAPEVIGRRGYDGAKSDVWSCGVILYVLLAGYLPFRDLNLMELYRKIEKAEYKVPIGLSQEVRDLLARILDPNPNSRISVEQIEECSWFENELTSTSSNSGECSWFENELTSTPSNIKFKKIQNVNVKADLTIRPRKLNAFDIISFSSGLDLSAFFDENESTKALRFTSLKQSNHIVGKIREFADKSGMRMKINDNGVMKLKGSKDGEKELMWIDVEVLEIATDVHLIELKIGDVDDAFENPNAAGRDVMLAVKDFVFL